MRLQTVLGGILATALAASVVIVLWQVVSRYLLGAPSGGTDELVRYLLVWIGLLGAAYATMTRRHLAIDLLPRRLEKLQGERPRAALELVIQLLVAAFALLVPIVGGLALVRLSVELGQRSASLDLPLGWVYAALPVAGVLILVDCLVTMLDALTRLRAAPGPGRARVPGREVPR